MPSLTVVVPSTGGEDVARAVVSLLASAESAGADVDVRCVWQSEETPPELPRGVALVPTFPVNVSYARNEGLRQAHTPLVAFVDADEVVDRGWVAGVLDAFEDGRVQAAFGPVGPLDDRGLPHGGYFDRDEPRWFEGPTPLPWEIGTGGSMAFHRSALLRLGGFDLRMGMPSPGRAGEDVDVIARLQRTGAPMRWVPEMRVYHPTVTEVQRLVRRYPYGYGLGRVTARLRSLRLLAGYGLAVAYAARDAVRHRSRRRARELTRTVAGFGAGLVRGDGWRAPDAALSSMPAAIRAELGERRLRGWEVPHRADPHFLWAAGSDLVLHLYVGDTERLAASIQARGQLEAGGAPAGIPRLRVVAADGGAVWLVEERLRGRPAGWRRRGAWWSAAVAWAEQLASRPASSLGATAWWVEARERLPEAVGPAWAGRVAEALDRVSGLPGPPAHGDFQPKNLLVSGGSIAVVDWECALPECLPGLDLMFLATTARRGRPDASVLSALSCGSEPPGGQVLAPLRSVGVGPEETPAMLLCCVAKWVADESVRRESPGVPPQPPLYAALLEEIGPVLAHGVNVGRRVDGLEAQGRPGPRRCPVLGVEGGWA